MGKSELKNISKPIISINCKSNEDVKNWSIENWQKLVDNFMPRVHHYSTG